MDKLASLKFDNPNNACHSLRCLAEWVRNGEIKIHNDAKDVSPPNGELLLGFSEPGGRR